MSNSNILFHKKITQVFAHLILMIICISIYLPRYMRMSKLRQILCQQSRIERTVWITQQSTPLRRGEQISAGEYLLIFSQNHIPQLGEQIHLIGRITDQSQCRTSTQITLMIENYSSIDKMKSSPFYLTHYPLESLAVLLRGYLRDTEAILYRFLPSQHVHVLLGMTFGRKYSSQAPESISMRAAGMLHVLVASGANIAILTGFLHALMRKIYSIKSIIIVSLITTTLYSVIVGAQAPIIRALLMFASVSFARLLGRPISWIYPLLIAVGLSLIFQPFSLFSVSFWLTVAATLAIFIDSQSSNTLIAATISNTWRVFLWTSPILLHVIGNVTLATLLSSLLLLWLVGPITICGLLLIFIQLIVPTGLFQFACWFLWLLLEVFIRSVNLFSSFTWLNISSSSFTPLGVILYYLVLICWESIGLALDMHDR